jgi:predicted nucleotidyltransferase
VDLGQPISSVIPSVQGSVLAVLVSTTRPLSQVEITNLVRPVASRSGVRKALANLETAGLVTREDHPPAALYVLNRDHVAANAIVELAQLRQRMLDRFTHELSQWSIPAVTAVMFGSAARGDGDSQSDIDLLVIRPDHIDALDATWAEQRGQLAARGWRWTGNEVNLVEYARSEFRRLWRAHEPFLHAADDEGVVLFGVSLRECASVSSAGTR